MVRIATKSWYKGDVISTEMGVPPAVINIKTTDAFVNDVAVWAATLARDHEGAIVTVNDKTSSFEEDW